MQYAPTYGKLRRGVLHTPSANIKNNPVNLANP